MIRFIKNILDDDNYQYGMSLSLIYLTVCLEVKRTAVKYEPVDVIVKTSTRPLTIKTDFSRPFKLSFQQKNYDLKVKKDYELKSKKPKNENRRKAMYNQSKYYNQSYTCELNEREHNWHKLDPFELAKEENSETIQKNFGEMWKKREEVTKKLFQYHDKENNVYKYYDHFRGKPCHTPPNYECLSFQTNRCEFSNFNRYRGRVNTFVAMKRLWYFERFQWLRAKMTDKDISKVGFGFHIGVIKYYKIVDVNGLVYNSYTRSYEQNYHVFKREISKLKRYIKKMESYLKKHKIPCIPRDLNAPSAPTLEEINKYQNKKSSKKLAVPQKASFFKKNDVTKKEQKDNNNQSIIAINNSFNITINGNCNIL